MTTILPDIPVSPLRQKLIEDMTMRHFSMATQRNYLARPHLSQQIPAQRPQH